MKGPDDCRKDGADAKAAAKDARLAEALRANLRRRKAQARARAERQDTDGPMDETDGTAPE